MDSTPWSTPSVRGSSSGATPIHSARMPQTTHTPSISQTPHRSAAAAHAAPVSTADLTYHHRIASSSPSAYLLAPQRNTGRAQILSVAASMGLHGQNDPITPLTDSQLSSLRPSHESLFPPSFHALPSTSLKDYQAWLAHAAHARHLLQKQNELRTQILELERSIEAHEREQDLGEILATRSMDGLSSSTWQWAQHLNALTTSQSDLNVDQRQPQPSQYQNIARTLSPTAATSNSLQSHYTPAPVVVQPSVRTLLDPPHAGKDRFFLDVQPELQIPLAKAVENICKDVAMWKEQSVGSQSAAENESETAAESESTPPAALAWTRSLPDQQQPLNTLLSSVVSNWSRLQRAADAISSAHQVTRELHAQERGSTNRLRELQQQERDMRRVDRGQLKSPPLFI